MGKHKSDDYKLSAVEYYLNMDKPSIRKVRKIYKCPRQSLYRWIKRYLQTGTDPNIIKYFINNKINLECTTKDKWKPLHFVCRYQTDLNIIKYLINKNVKTSKTNENKDWIDIMMQKTIYI